MEGFRDISSENPIQEIWKLLRYFLDLEYTADRIRTIHGLSGNQQKANVKKQAEQIGYCIRQAQEYFTASSQVVLTTQPLLLYYGAVSLSTALVLLRQNGNYSIDVLRKKNKHRHHGLELVTEIGSDRKADLTGGVEHFLSSVKCNCHIEHDIPWGHFALLYQSLIPCSYTYEMEIHDAGRATFVRRQDNLPCSDMLHLEAIKNQTFDMLELVKALPDMYSSLISMGIQSDLCRGGIRRVVTQHYKTHVDGKSQLDKTVSTYQFFFNDIDETSKEYTLSYYRQQNPDITVIADLGRSLHLRYTEEIQEDKEDKDYTRYLPDAVNSINGGLFYILKPETYIHEPAAYLMLLFCLGMLSRYYPDVWIRIIDNNVRIAEITQSLLNVIHKKFPNMILNQMTSYHHHVHV